MILEIPQFFVNGFAILITISMILLLIVFCLMLVNKIYNLCASNKYFITVMYRVMLQKIGYERVSKNYAFKYNGKRYICTFKQEGAHDDN